MAPFTGPKLRLLGTCSMKSSYSYVAKYSTNYKLHWMKKLKEKSQRVFSEAGPMSLNMVLTPLLGL